MVHSLANTASVQERIGEMVRRIVSQFSSEKVILFGSHARGEAGPDSDVDLLVIFDPGHTPGLEFFAMQDELTEILGRKVDLNTPNFLSRYFRDQVMADAEVLIDRAG